MMADAESHQGPAPRRPRAPADARESVAALLAAVLSCAPSWASTITSRRIVGMQEVCRVLVVGWRSPGFGRVLGQRRRPQHQLQAVGEEDRDERASRRVGQPVDRGAVDLQALRLPRLEADGDAGAPPRRARRRAPAASRRRRSAPPRARSPSGTSARCRRSRAPRAGWSCRRRCGPVTTVSPGPSRTSAAS